MSSYMIRQHSSNTLISLIALYRSSPQQGVKWSVIGSVMQDAPPASAMAPCGVTVFSPDLRLGNRNRQVDSSYSPISGQAYARYPYGVGWHMPGVLIVDQTVDHFTPVAGTRMRQ